MAAKKTKTPAQRQLLFSMTGGDVDTSTTKYLDLSKFISRANRRLYRQGRAYHVKKVTITARGAFNPVAPTDPGTSVMVSAAPDTWVTREAWKRGFRVWSKMQKDAMHNSGNDLRGTWNDFKIYMNLNSVLLANQLEDSIDVEGNNYGAGEWVISDFTVPKEASVGEDQFYATLMGDHSGSQDAYTSVSLIKSYGESRVTVQADDPNAQPDIPDDPLNNVFDFGTTIDNVLTDVLHENDAPPYLVNAYPGDNANGPKPAVMQIGTMSDGRCVLGGFTAICGLMAITTKSSQAGVAYDILVELSEGSYRGIKADVI